MVGWGQAGYLSEVDPAGQVLFNAHLPPDWESYRTYALALVRPAGRTAGAGGGELGRQPRSVDRLRELERRDRSRLLAGARGVLAQRSRGGRGRSEGRL